MRRTRRISITKRDGSCEPFSLPKLRICLNRVLSEGGADPALAEPLARAVAVHLARSHRDGPATSEYVYRCACAALEQTGLSPAAQRLTLHRQGRAALRRRLRLIKSDGEPQRWRKGWLVREIVRCGEVRRPAARYLAARIERRLLMRRLTRVTHQKVYELIGKELRAWGLCPETVEGATPRDRGLAQPWTAENDEI